MAKAKTKKASSQVTSLTSVRDGRSMPRIKKTMKIVFDEFLPKWNYRAVPQPV